MKREELRGMIREELLHEVYSFQIAVRQSKASLSAIQDAIAKLERRQGAAWDPGVAYQLTQVAIELGKAEKLIREIR